jgi:hypothetical protein
LEFCRWWQRSTVLLRATIKLEHLARQSPTGKTTQTLRAGIDSGVVDRWQQLFAGHQGRADNEIHCAVGFCATSGAFRILAAIEKIGKTEKNLPFGALGYRQVIAGSPYWTLAQGGLLQPPIPVDYGGIFKLAPLESRRLTA